MSKAAKAHASWFEILQEKANGIMESFDFSYDNLVRIATYCGVACGVGFVLKRYGTALMFGLVIAGVTLYALSYFDFIIVNTDKLKLFLGFSYNATLQDVLDLYWTWIKNNIHLSISIVVGFIIGYKLG